MPRFVLLAAALVTVAGPGAATAQTQDRPALVAALDSMARAHAADDGVAGVSVAVVRGADTLLLAGYGQVDLEWNVPTPRDASASYEIGSVTKQFTAAALLKLVEEGMVELDADFTEYVDFDAGGHVVPVRRLLDHTSGIRGYTEMPVFGELAMKKLPRDSLLALVEGEPFLFEPGTAQIYNNTAFFLVGLLVEAVSGRSYEDFVVEELFAPSGMDDSYYCDEAAVRDRRAHGYDVRDEALVRKGYLDHTWPYAAGSLCSTAGDLVRWNQALHGGEVLSAESYRLLTTPMPLRDGTPLRYAMGIGVSDDRGRRVLSHGGGINGFLTATSWFPEEEMVVVVLQNTANQPTPGALADALVERVLGPLPARPTVAYDGELDALVGEYHGPTRAGHTHFLVGRDGDQLVLRRKGGEGDGLRLPHVGDGVWRRDGVRFWFERVGDRVLSLRFEQGGHSVMERLPG